MNFELINDLTFVAYSLIKIENNKVIHIDDAMNKLLELGFNKKHIPKIVKMHPDIESFMLLSLMSRKSLIIGLNAGIPHTRSIARM